MIAGIRGTRRRTVAATSSFGNTGDTGNYPTYGSELMLVAFTTPADMGSVTKLTLALGSSVTAGARLLGAIYTKTGADTTGALVAQTPETTLEALQTSVDLVFASAVALSPSTEYWFGSYHGDFVNLIDTGAGATYTTDFFAYTTTAPAGPFTVFTFNDAIRIDITYTPA